MFPLGVPDLPIEPWAVHPAAPYWAYNPWFNMAPNLFLYGALDFPLAPWMLPPVAPFWAYNPFFNVGLGGPPAPQAAPAAHAHAGAPLAREEESWLQRYGRSVADILATMPPSMSSQAVNRIDQILKAALRKCIARNEGA
ncbi:uncharacterized protein LOC144142192 [Haemaphysalis longicornis]